MKYLKIQNDGVLDIRLVALMGGTTKSKDKFKIGKFGTGLKYTLAYLYRNNIDFRMFSGVELIPIGIERETIKETEFEIICINNQRTSITTSIGQDWVAWMIIRELWCNALDEGGYKKDVVYDETALQGEENKTTFYIQLTPEIQDVIDNWGQYFIHNDSPLWENEDYAIYENRSGGKLKLYKNGVLIYLHPHTESLFYYDIKGADINEMREFKGSVSYAIFEALKEPNNETISYFLNNIKEAHYEGSELDYNWFTSFKNIWKETLEGKKIARYGDRGYYSENGVDVDFSNVIELPKRTYEALVKDFEGIGVLAMADDKAEFYEVPNSLLKEKVAECINKLAGYGYHFDSSIRIKFGMFNKTNKKAAANRKNKQIMISEACQKLSSLSIINLLIENEVYILNGLEKETPAYYKYFIDRYTRQLLGIPISETTEEKELAVDETDDLPF